MLRSFIFVSVPVLALSVLRIGFIHSQSRQNNLKYIAEVAKADLESQTGQTVEIITRTFQGNSVRSIVDATCGLVDSEVPIIVSESSSSHTELQIDTSQYYNIPLISSSATNPFLNSESRPYLLTMLSSDYYQSQVIYDFLVEYQYFQVTLMSSTDSYGVNGLIKLNELMGTNPQFHDIQNLYIQGSHTSSRYGDTELNILKDSLARIIVLNCPAINGDVILSKAQKLGLLEKDFLWIVTDSITSQPQFLSKNGVYHPDLEGLIGVTSALLRSKEFYDFKTKYAQLNPANGGSEIGIYEVMSYDALVMSGILLAKLPTVYQRSGASCTSNTTWAEGEAVKDRLLSSESSGITGIIKFSDNGENTRVLYDVMNFKNDIFQTVGTWGNVSRLNISESIIFLGGSKTPPFGSTETLTGTHFRLGVVEEEPFILKRTTGCNGTDCYDGYCIDLVKKLSGDLNFTYEYVQPEDGKFGSKDPLTGKWNGMVADLMNKKTDMITVHLSASSVRKEVIDFSAAFMDAGIVAVVKGESGQNTFFFLSPFSTKVWFFIIACNFVVTALICMLGKLSPYGKYGSKILALQTCICSSCALRRSTLMSAGKSYSDLAEVEHDCLVERDEQSDKLDDLSFFNSIWLITVGLVGQAAESLPYCASARALLFSWWLFILVIISMYTANLTAFLTLSNLGITLNSVKDLLKQNEYRWGLIGSRYPESLLLNNLDKDYIELVNKGEKLRDLNHALETVKEGGFVFIDESPVLAHNLKDDCEIFSIGSEFQKFVYSFGLPKNAPYSNLINRYMLKYREEGYMDQLWSKWSAGNRACSNTVGRDKMLDIDTLAGVFYILAIGAGIAILIFLLEGFLSAYRDTKQSKSSLITSLAKLLKLKRGNIMREWFGFRLPSNNVNINNKKSSSANYVIRNTSVSHPDEEEK